jgi:hypothetical protein
MHHVDVHECENGNSDRDLKQTPLSERRLTTTDLVEIEAGVHRVAAFPLGYAVIELPKVTPFEILQLSERRTIIGMMGFGQGG